MALSHDPSLSMRALWFSTRSKYSSELRLLYEQVHKEVIYKIIMVNEMWDMTSWEYQVQTVITLLAASHSTASFVVNLLACDWLILTLQWFIDTNMAKHHQGQKEKIACQLLQLQTWCNLELRISNLLSEKWMCKKGLWRSFDTWELYMHNRDDKLVLETSQKGGVYVVKHIAKKLHEFALSAMCQWCEHKTVCSSQVTELMSSDLSVQNVNCDQEFFMLDMWNHDLAFFMPSMSNHDSADEDNCDCTDSRDHKIKMYKLWHWHFAHLDSAKLCNLHKMMTLSKSIFIVKKKDHVCEVCALTKFRNKREHQVSERKITILNLVSIDICEPLPLSYTDYSYLLKIVDNHLWKIWTILLKHQSDAPQTLKKWWLKTEL